MQVTQPQNHIVIAVKALLLHGRRALILHRSPTAPHSPGIWEHTGGKLEFGETLTDALLREIREETNLAATVERLLYAVTLKTGPHRQIVVLCYLCTAHNNAVQLSSEHDAYLWATRAEIEQLIDKQILQNMHTYHVFDQIDIEAIDTDD